MRLFYIFILMIILGGCGTASFHKNQKLRSNSNDAVVNIALVNPQVELSLLNASGMNEPQAKWTNDAKKYISIAIAEKFKGFSAKLINDHTTNNTDNLDNKEMQLIKLHQAVGNSIHLHQYLNPLPTKAGKFSWTLGIDAKYLQNKYNADYALFINIRDSYAGASRVALIIASAFLGVNVPAGQQFGYASLVDLNSGDIIWFNRLARTTGSLKSIDGAKDTISQLLNGFPE